MPRRASEHPTTAELEILNVLWSHGPSTVRQVHDILQHNRRTTLTTTLKLLQMMTEKNITTRVSPPAGPHLYSASAPQEQTQAGLLLNLVQKAFRGSVGQMMMCAVESGQLNTEERRQIRKLL